MKPPAREIKCVHTTQEVLHFSLALYPHTPPTLQPELSSMKALQLTHLRMFLMYTFGYKKNFATQTTLAILTYLRSVHENSDYKCCGVDTTLTNTQISHTLFEAYNKSYYELLPS